MNADKYILKTEDGNTFSRLRSWINLEWFNNV